VARPDGCSASRGQHCAISTQSYLAVLTASEACDLHVGRHTDTQKHSLTGVTAALLLGRLLGREWQATLDLANRHAAYVASQPSATPVLPSEVWASYELNPV